MVSHWKFPSNPFLIEKSIFQPSTTVNQDSTALLSRQQPTSRTVSIVNRPLSAMTTRGTQARGTHHQRAIRLLEATSQIHSHHLTTLQPRTWVKILLLWKLSLMNDSIDRPGKTHSEVIRLPSCTLQLKVRALLTLPNHHHQRCHRRRPSSRHLDQLHHAQPKDQRQTHSDHLLSLTSMTLISRWVFLKQISRLALV